MPAPSFYGFIAQLCPNKTSRVPISCLLYTGIVAIALLLAALGKKLDWQGGGGAGVAGSWHGSKTTSNSKRSENLSEDDDVCESPEGKA